MSQSDTVKHKPSLSELDKLKKENLELKTKIKTLCSVLSDAGLQLQVLSKNFSAPNPQ